MGDPFPLKRLKLTTRLTPVTLVLNSIYMALTLDLEGGLVRLATKLDGPDPQPRVEVRGFVRY